MKKFLFLIGLMASTIAMSADTLAKPTTQVMFKGNVWEVSSQMRYDFEEDWGMGDMLNLILHTDKSTLKNSTWISPEVIEKLPDDVVILEVPYLSCGIGYDLYILSAETDLHLFFEGFNGFGGNTLSTALVMRKL